MSALNKYTVNGKKEIKLKNYPAKPNIDAYKKEEYIEKTNENLKQILDLQEKLYSAGKESVLIIFQAMDAAGKDGAIKNLLTGVNPSGVHVHSFKSPSEEELSHDYLWRCIRKLPARGEMAVFNRSYYEDVLIVKVHKLYESYKMPKRCLPNIIEKRYAHINNFEDYLYDNGYRIVKIFLNVSKDEQKKRFLDRIEQKIKNWKFSAADMKERAYWKDYQNAYEDAINATASENSPWYVIPADKKWYARYLVSEAVLKVLREIDPRYPMLSDEQLQKLAKDKEKLLASD